MALDARYEGCSWKAELCVIDPREERCWYHVDCYAVPAWWLWDCHWGMMHGLLAACHWLALTHWSWVMHICISNLTFIGSDNGLSPGRHQAIIWTNAGILWIGPLGINFSENWIRIQTFSFQKMHLKMLSVKWCPFCLGLNVFTWMGVIETALHSGLAAVHCGYSIFQKPMTVPCVA